MAFPADFNWGVATAAYQIEGGWNLDGKGPSIWDAFTHETGRTFENQTADVTCDHYHRWREDVALMRQLGVNAYRCSLSWSRILPNGFGQPNAKGIAFYDSLIDELLEAGVAPWITLYHWDLPLALHRRGGFTNRDFVEWFGDFASLAASKFGDRVKHWLTFNEPPVIVGFGYQDGKNAPGLKLTFSECLLAAHHLLMAHGRGVQALRAHCSTPVKISIAQTAREFIPDDNSFETVEAARRRYFACTGENFWNLSWWADPIAFGKYPDDGLKHFEKYMPATTSEDMALIAQPIDFLAYNCYTGWLIKAGIDGAAELISEGLGLGNPRGTLPWLNITPSSPYWAAKFQTERYKLPIVFSENGFNNVDFIHLDGAVHDPQRIDFIARYLGFIKKALSEGVDIRGYFYWSLLDNFEWSDGFKERFGLVHVDYQTQKRTPKDSFQWYQRIAASNGECLPP